MQPPLFAPFRALGYITDDVPFAVQRRGKDSWVTVSVGKCWQLYNYETLRLVLVGPQASTWRRSVAAAAIICSMLNCALQHRTCIRVHAFGSRSKDHFDTFRSPLCSWHTASGRWPPRAISHLRPQATASWNANALPGTCAVDRGLVSLMLQSCTGDAVSDSLDLWLCRWLSPPALLHHRTGTYRAAEGVVLQLLCLGDHLLSLYSSGHLRIWRIGSYEEPEVGRPSMR